MGNHCAKWCRISLRAPGDDRAREGYPEANRVHQGLPARRDLLDPFERDGSRGLEKFGTIRDCFHKHSAKSNRPSLHSHDWTSAFEENSVSPSIAELSDSLAHTNFAKFAGLVQGNARSVLREDASLQRPDFIQLGFPNKFDQ